MGSGEAMNPSCLPPKTPYRTKFFCFFFSKKRSASYRLLRRNRTRSRDETSTAPAATAAARCGNGTS